MVADPLRSHLVSELEDRSELPDAEQRWAARIRAGDLAAFEAMYRAYYRPLVGFLYNYLDSEALAEEQVQELFLTIWRFRADWELRSTLRAYLYRSARNRALNFLKHRRIEDGVARAAVVEERAFGMAEPRAAVDEGVEADELAAAARRVTEQLPPRCRMAFSLCREHGLTYAEAAQVMGISEHTVKIQMTRALKAIRRALAPWLT